MNDQILNMYFKHKMKQKDIADKLQISKYKVSRIVSKDSRYIEEKERRKIENKVKHEKSKKQQIYEKRLNDQISYEIMKRLHIQSSIEMSTQKGISNRAFRTWNASIYDYNAKSKRYCYHLES